MSLKKKISIKPIHLIVGGKNKEKKKQKKTSKKMIQSLFKPNKVKQELLEKIKKHQQKKRTDLFQKGNNNNDSDFSNSFQDSLLYLDNVTKHVKKEKHKKKTLRKSDNLTNNIAPAPPYGILKGGSKPLYSEYRKTMKNRNNVNHTKLKFSVDENEIKSVEKPMFVTERQNKLQEIKNKINPIIKPKIKPKKYRKTKTLKKKLILGKTQNKVSVLIKNKKTRKRIKNETLKLKKKSLEEIKQYLRIHNLIKIGTDAPEDVLRNTFENAFLSGNVYNKNSDNLIHNYMNTN